MSVRSQPVKGGWTEEEEDELRVLVIEYREREIEEGLFYSFQFSYQFYISISRGRFPDAIDWIQSNLINNTRTRRVILKKLKDMMLLTDYKGLKKSSGSSRPPKDWQEQEVIQLTELFEEFREATGSSVYRLPV